MKPHRNDVSVVFRGRQSWDPQEIGKRVAWLNIMKMRDCLWWCRVRLPWTTCGGGNLSDKLETVLTKAEDMHTVFQKDHSNNTPNKKMCACLTIQPCQKRLSKTGNSQIPTKVVKLLQIGEMREKEHKVGCGGTGMNWGKEHAQNILHKIQIIIKIMQDH